MSMKLDLGKVFFFILLLVLSTMTAMAGNIKGTVLDKQTKEIVLPQSLDNALSNPDYCVFKCKKAEDGYEVEEVK